MKLYNYIYICLFAVLLSQNTELMINDIAVSGNVNMLSEDIINFSGLSSNSYVTAIEIQNAINRLWLLNRFSDIQIDLEESYGNTKLIINVKEFPILNNIIFEGDYFKFRFLRFRKSKSDLKTISELESGSVLSEQKINRAINLLKKDFIERNFHDIKISHIIEDNNNKKDIIFNINAGKKLKIKDIKIILNNNEIDNVNILKFIKHKISKDNTIIRNNIVKHLSEIDQWKWYVPWRGHYNNEKIEGMINNLNSFFRYKGYLDFNIVDYKLIKSQNIFNRDYTTLLIEIESGPEYHVNDIEFTGNYIFTDSTIRSQLVFNSGDVFDGMKFDICNMNLTNLYRDKGYLFSQITPSMIPISDSLLNIRFDINEKSIVSVNKVVIKGNETTKENVLRRDIEIMPGEIFSQSAIMESYRKLFMLNFFESVTPDIVPIEGKNEVDVVFNVMEKGSGQLNFSAGYSGLLGFTGGGGFTFPNFLGTGQNFSFNYQRGISSQQSNVPLTGAEEATANQQFSMNYVEPRLFNTYNLVGISFSYQERGQNNSQPFDSRIMGAGIRFGRRFQWPDKYFKGSWLLSGSKREYFSDNIDNLLYYYSSSIEDYIEYKDDQYIFPTSGLKIVQSISRDNRDHPEFPTKGSQFNWNFTCSGIFLGGDEDYLKNEIKFHWYNEAMNRLVIHQNFKVGVLNQFEASSGRSIVPYSARFRMGGALPYGEMLRGYGDNMIGPIGASYPKGGNVMLKYGFELRYLVSENPNMYLLYFAEAGNVWDTVDLVDPFKLRRSMGVGVRVMMPMLGVLGYDAAYGFDSSVEEFLTGNNGAHGWEYHFIFGMPIN